MVFSFHPRSGVAYFKRFTFWNERKKQDRSLACKWSTCEAAWHISASLLAEMNEKTEQMLRLWMIHPRSGVAYFKRFTFWNERRKGAISLPFKWCISHELFYRLVSKQVSSPQQSLTSVFGMGTGGPSAIRSLIWLLDGSNKVNDLSSERRNSNYSLELLISHLCSDTHCVLSIGGSSPRSISIGQLNTLLCLHLRPIKLVVCKWPYSF